jgi:predicted Zn-dependent peptidase
MAIALPVCHNHSMTTEPRDIQKHVLPNGLVVITETMSHVRSVSVGVWIRNGSRREIPEENGLAHFMEHMVFKGTERRSAEAIAREMDSVGGMLDAFTSKEQICFNAKVLDEHLPIAFDVIADLVLRPKFDSEDVKKERQVVLEEIKMDLDNPEYMLHEIFTRGFWPGHALGRPILGTPDTVKKFNREGLRTRFQHWFAPDHLVVTAAGNVTHDKVLELVQREFGQLPAAGTLDDHIAPHTHAPIHLETKKELEQVHLCIGVPSLPLGHERRFAAAVLNNLLGGGMSSRLFQNIREKRGLAYAVFSELTPYSDAGMLTVYAGSAKETVGQVIDLTIQEFRSMKESLVTEEELLRSKNHLKGSLMLSLESTSSRMSNLARQELYFGRFYSLDEILAGIDAVTREDLQIIAQDFFKPERIAVTVLGPLNGFTLERSRLAC